MIAALILMTTPASATEAVDHPAESHWVERTADGKLVDRHGNHCVPQGQGRYKCVTPDGHHWSMETDPCAPGGGIVRRILRALVLARDNIRCD